MLHSKILNVKLNLINFAILSKLFINLKHAIDIGDSNTAFEFHTTDLTTWHIRHHECRIWSIQYRDDKITKATTTGFEPVRAEPIGFQVQPLNLSGTLSVESSRWTHRYYKAQNAYQKPLQLAGAGRNNVWNEHCSKNGTSDWNFLYLDA